MASSIKIAQLAIAGFLVLVAGCGGGAGSSAPPPPVPPPPISKIEAYRFLNQATFGATEAEAQRLNALGTLLVAWDVKLRE